ncbi:MAG: DNA replication/repair protein RecF [Candidatus Thiodiazotropha sp.]
MQLQRLKIENLRNIKEAEILPSKNINLITGSNGAGKTTLLEAIYLLARTRSFRQSQNKTLIKRGEEQLTLFSEFQSETGSGYKIGLSKKKDSTIVHKNRKKITKLSELAKTIPLTIITPNIQRIVEEGPTHRRKLLNWGMFHVEPLYAQLAQRYNQTITQRNRALIRKGEDLSVWTKQLVDLGNQLNHIQNQYVVEWNAELKDLYRTAGDHLQCKLELFSGWKTGLSFEAALTELLTTDQDRGFTSAGPHRLDVRIVVEGRGVKNFFSRGQNKLLALNLMIAQTQLLKNKKKEKPILLVDDIKSELDNESYLRVIETVSDLNIQTFITDLNQSLSPHLEKDGFKMFHVEHGHISEL